MTAGAEADLFSVFVELAALRNEVRTESRLVKEALDQFRGVFDTLQSSHATLEQELKRAQAEAHERGRALLRPLLLDLLDLRDRLAAGLQQPTVAAAAAAGLTAGVATPQPKPEAGAKASASRCGGSTASWPSGASCGSRWWGGRSIPARRASSARRRTRASATASWWTRCAPGFCGTTNCCVPPR